MDELTLDDREFEDIYKFYKKIADAASSEIKVKE